MLDDPIAAPAYSGEEGVAASTDSSLVPKYT